MATTQDRTGSHPRVRRDGRELPVLPFLALGSLVAIGAVVFIAYVLWPRWPDAPAGLDARPLPITIAGVAFNVPPAAIREPAQRRPGAQERIDLAFMWPTLTPPDPNAKPAAPAPDAALTSGQAIDRIFVTISAAGKTIAPMERVQTIYPRYLTANAVTGPGGLAVLAFRDDTPYRGEDLIYDSTSPESFLVRCTRKGPGETPGTCLSERRIETADIVARFPRDWLEDWPMVAGNIDHLIAIMHPPH